MIAKGHHFSAETRRVAVELWNAKVPLKKIRDQQQMSKAILMCLLAYAPGTVLTSLSSLRRQELACITWWCPSPGCWERSSAGEETPAKY
jgi:hypothetical protein